MPKKRKLDKKILDRSIRKRKATMKEKKESAEDYMTLRVWIREVSWFIIAVALFIFAFTLAPAEVIREHFSTENFKNAVYFLLVIVVCIKEYKRQKSSENMWRLIFMITGFYFGVTVGESDILN